MMQLQDLLNLVGSGEATPGHHAVIRGLLKDNGVIVNQEHEDGNPLESILAAIEAEELDN